MKIAKTQLERVKKVKSHLREIGKVHFKSTSKVREKLDMNQGQLRDAVAILIKQGVLNRSGRSANNTTYEVNFDLL